MKPGAVVLFGLGCGVAARALDQPDTNPKQRAAQRILQEAHQAAVAWLDRMREPGDCAVQFMEMKAAAQAAMAAAAEVPATDLVPAEPATVVPFPSGPRP